MYMNFLVTPPLLPPSSIITLTLGFIRIHNAAPLRGGNTHNQIEPMLLGKFAPAIRNVAIILGRRG
jgi:hypothetical protein